MLAKKKETFPPDRALVPSLKKACYMLLERRAYSDDEIAEKLRCEYPNLKGTTEADVAYHRRMYNVLAAQGGHPEVYRLVRDDNGMLIEFHRINPLPKITVEVSKDQKPKPRIQARKK